MRIVRGIFGTLLMVVAGFLGGFAALESGAMHGWGELSADRLIRKGLVWAAGCIVFALLAMATARTGNSPGKGALGRLFTLGGVVLGVQAVVVANHYPVDSLVYAVPALVLMIVSAVLLA